MIDKIYITYMCVVLLISWFTLVSKMNEPTYWTTDVAIFIHCLFNLGAPATAIYGLIKVWL